MINRAGPVHFRQWPALIMADRDNRLIFVVTVDRQKLLEIQPAMHRRNCRHLYKPCERKTDAIDVRMNYVETGCLVVHIAQHRQMKHRSEMIEAAESERLWNSGRDRCVDGGIAGGE